MNTKRIAAALALAAGVTTLAGVTAHAETTSVATSTQSSVSTIAPTEGHASATMGPFVTRWLCNFHKSNVGPGGGTCYKSGGSWYYEAA